MARTIAIIQGHPDPRPERFGRALADAYAKGAAEGGHAVTVIDVAVLDFPLLRTKEEFEGGAPPPAIARAQEAIGRAEHLAIFYPLWLGPIRESLVGMVEAGAGARGKWLRRMRALGREGR